MGEPDFLETTELTMNLRWVTDWCNNGKTLQQATRVTTFYKGEESDSYLEWNEVQFESNPT